jgi:tetratricopeptide (TPR) repeat protein
MGQVARTLVAIVALALALGLPRAASAQAARWRAGPRPTSPPSAAAIDEARQRNTKALKLYQDEGAVEAALAEFERSYDLAPSIVILFNIGQAARTARDYALALHAYERYLADGGSEIRADRRQEALDQIRELKTFVAWLDIRVNVEGARIFVDDAEVGTSPLADKVAVNAGRLRVRAASGSLQDSKVIVVPGGDQATVEL